MERQEGEIHYVKACPLAKRSGRKAGCNTPVGLLPSSVGENQNFIGQVAEQNAHHKSTHNTDVCGPSATYPQSCLSEMSYRNRRVGQDQKTFSAVHSTNAVYFLRCCSTATKTPTPDTEERQTSALKLPAVRAGPACFRKAPLPARSRVQNSKQKFGGRETKTECLVQNTTAGTHLVAGKHDPAISELYLGYDHETFNKNSPINHAPSHTQRPAQVLSCGSTYSSPGNRHVFHAAACGISGTLRNGPALLTSYGHLST